MLSVTILIDTLLSPIDLKTNPSGRFRVVESSTGKCDGRVSIITTDDKVYPLIINSKSNSNEMGVTDGPTNLLYIDECLYIFDRKGKIFIVYVENFKPVDPSVKVSTLVFENIGIFVPACNIVNNPHDSHPCNLTTCSVRAMNITDAGANAIIKRTKNRILSVLVAVAGIDNPLSIGPPKLQSVPTGIIWVMKIF